MNEQVREKIKNIIKGVSEVSCESGVVDDEIIDSSIESIAALMPKPLKQNCGKPARHNMCGIWLCGECYDKLIHPDKYKPQRCLGCITPEQLKEIKDTGKIKELEG